MTKLFEKLLEIDPEGHWKVEEIDTPQGGEAHFRRYLYHVLFSLMESSGAEQGYVGISGVECGQFTPFVAIGRDSTSIKPKPTYGGKGLVSEHLVAGPQFEVISNPAPDDHDSHLGEVSQRVLIKLLGHGELFGFICLDRMKPNQFDEAALEELRDCLPLMTSLVAEENFSMRVRQLAGPFEIVRSEALYDEIVDRTSRAFAADGTILQIYVPEYETLVVEASRGGVDPELRRALERTESVSSRVLTDLNHAWVLGTVGDNSRTRGLSVGEGELVALRDAGVRSFIVMRLDSKQSDVMNGTPIGTLAYYFRRPHAFSYRDVALFRSFCQRAADAIALHRQTEKLVESYENLRRQSLTITRVEIVSLIAHDLFHKSFHTCNAIENYIDRCRRTLNNRSETRTHAHLEADATHAREAAVRVQKTLEQLRSIQQRGVEEFEKTTRFDLSEVIDEVEKTLNGALSRNKVKIVRDVSPNLAIVGARSVLSQVFFNLVINALDAAHSRATMKPMAIHIHARLDQQGAMRKIIVQFWDEGPGIDRVAFKNPADIFEIGRTTRPNGTGTGLPVARILMGKYYHGELRLEDPATARFKITIPVV